MIDDNRLELAKERYCILTEHPGTSDLDAIASIRAEFGEEIATCVQYEYMYISPSIDTLIQYLDQGIGLIPTRKTETGSIIQLHHNKVLITIQKRVELEYWLGRGIERFLFIPRDYGFACIDIDRGHDNGGDGIAEFYQWLKQSHLESLQYLKNVEGGSFPCWVSTPSGGIHLYFKCKSQAKLSQNITQNVEIKYNGRSLTSAGSVKIGKPYTLHGNLSDAPIIPYAMLQYLSKRLDEELRREAMPNPVRTFPKKKYTPEQCLDFARKDSNGGAHDTIFRMAIRLKREGYPLDQALTIIKATPEHQNRNDIKDTDSCIKSVYKKD